MSHLKKMCALLAQLVERTTLNRVVVGSIPTQGGTVFFLIISAIGEALFPFFSFHYY